MKTETLQKAKELQKRLEATNILANLIYEELSFTDLFKVSSDDLINLVKRERINHLHNTRDIYKAEIDKLKEQLAELQDEPECVNSCSVVRPLTLRVLDQDIKYLIESYERTTGAKEIIGIELTYLGSGCGRRRVKIQAKTKD